MAEKGAEEGIHHRDAEAQSNLSLFSLPPSLMLWRTRARGEGMDGRLGEAPLPDRGEGIESDNRDYSMS